MSDDHAYARTTEANRETPKTGVLASLVGPLTLGILVALAMATMIAMAMNGSPAAATTGGAGTSAAVPTAGSTGDRYDRLWGKFTKKNRRWAKRTSACESGGDPTIHNSSGDYHGAFQFTLGTWQTAPRSPGGDPHSYPWRVQAVVAVSLMKRDGAGAWPVCG